MPRLRVLFELSMPGVASWDGKWSGEGKPYNLVRSMSEARVKELNIPTSWSHPWSDGWCARITSRVLNKGERAPKSAGFCGYEWMVDRIIRWGDTTCRCEWRPDNNEEGWENCIHCRCGRQIQRQEAGAA